MADVIDESGVGPSGWTAPDGTNWPDQASYLQSLVAGGAFGNTDPTTQGPIQPNASELSAYNKDRYDTYIAEGGDPRKLSSGFNTGSPLGSEILASGQTIDGKYNPPPGTGNGYGFSGYGTGTGTGKQYAPYDVGSGHTKWDEIVATLQNQRDLEDARAKNAVDVENLRGLSAKEVETLRGLSAKEVENIRAAEQRHQVDTGSANEFLKEQMAQKGPKDAYSNLFTSRGMFAPQGYAPAPMPLTDGIIQAYKNVGITDMHQIQDYLTGGGQPSASQWGVLGSMPDSFDTKNSPYGQVVGNAQYGNPLGIPNAQGQSAPQMPSAPQGATSGNSQYNIHNTQAVLGTADNVPGQYTPSGPMNIDGNYQSHTGGPDQGGWGQLATPQQSPVPPFQFGASGPDPKPVPQLQFGVGYQQPPPGVPSFDKGGMVPGAKGQPVLAVVHAGETIRNPQQEAALKNGEPHSLPVVPGQTHFANGGVVTPFHWDPNQHRWLGGENWNEDTGGWNIPANQNANARPVPALQFGAGITYQQPVAPQPTYSPPPPPTSAQTPQPDPNRGPGWYGNHNQTSPGVPAQPAPKLQIGAPPPNEAHYYPPQQQRVAPPPPPTPMTQGVTVSQYQGPSQAIDYSNNGQPIGFKQAPPPPVTQPPVPQFIHGVGGPNPTLTPQISPAPPPLAPGGVPVNQRDPYTDYSSNGLPIGPKAGVPQPTPTYQPPTTPTPNQPPAPTANPWGNGMAPNVLPPGAKWTDTNPATGHPYNSTWNPASNTWQVTGGTPYIPEAPPTRPQNVAPIGYWAQHPLPTSPGTSISHDAQGNIVRVYDGETGHVYDANGNLLGTVPNHGGGTYSNNSGTVTPSAVAPPGTPNASNNTPVSFTPPQGSIAGPAFPTPVGTPAPGSTTSTTGNPQAPGPLAPGAPPAPPMPPPPAPITGPIGAPSVPGSGAAPGSSAVGPPVPGSAGKPPFDLNKLDPYTRSLVDSNGRPIPPSAQQWKDMPTSGHEAFQNYTESVAGVNFNDLMDTAKNLYPVAGAPVATGFK